MSSSPDPTSVTMSGRESPESAPPDSEEVAFLRTYDMKRYPRPSVAVDVVALTIVQGRFGVLLSRRTEPPARGSFGLPGTFVRLDETLEDAAVRALAVKTGLTDIFLEQLYTFGSPGRDPRGRVISVAYYALVPGGDITAAIWSHLPEGGAFAWVRAPFEGETPAPVSVYHAGGELALAFDHASIIGTAIARLRGKLWYAPVAFEFVSPEFTLLDLLYVYQTILGHPLNKNSFRRRIMASGLIGPVGRTRDGLKARPAELFRFLGHDADARGVPADPSTDSDSPDSSDLEV